MKLTITIEDEHGAETVVEQTEARRPALTSAEGAVELAASSAGVPPSWLVEELQGGEPQLDPTEPTDAVDAGAARASGNGFVAIPA
jgi:hypothetical protein